MYQHPKTINFYTKNKYPTLPKEGWIKPCVNVDCRTYTSKFFILSNKKYYCCNTCYINYDMEDYVKQIVLKIQ